MIMLKQKEIDDLVTDLKSIKGAINDFVAEDSYNMGYKHGAKQTADQIISKITKLLGQTS
jgi:hypothetical protein